MRLPARSALLLLTCALLSFLHAPARAQTFSSAELEALAAPIALYPDDLLSHILVAATRPADVEQAARASGSDNPDWNASVRALVPFPEILQRMAESREWLFDLGNAVSAQRGELMRAVQALRQHAQTAGHLRSDEQHLVQQQGQLISVVPAAPEVVYVRYYDPLVVYGVWRPAHRVVRWRPWPTRTVRSPPHWDTRQARHERRQHSQEFLRNGPPSAAAQMQQNMPGAVKRGNGDPSPARQMQLRQGASSVPYEPVPESKRQPIIQSDPRRARPEDPR